MSASPVPEARLEASVLVRGFARLRPIGRFLRKAAPGVFIVLAVMGAIGGAGFGIYSCSAAASERKERECKAVAMRLERVERIVRETGSLRAYVREPESKRLLEYRFPADSGPYGTVTFFADVPDGGTLRIVSTSVLEPNEQCIQTVEVHVRSARDIE